VPELPEVETVRRGLEVQVVGRRITKVEVGRERTVRRTSRQALIDGLTGATVVAANRRGKYLLCPLDTGDEMMVHLRMSGRLLVTAAGTERLPHTHVVMHLSGTPRQELWFVDPRTFGEVVVFDPTNAAVEMPELARMGIDPIVDGMTSAHTVVVKSGAFERVTVKVAEVVPTLPSVTAMSLMIIDGMVSSSRMVPAADAVPTTPSVMPVMFTL
jgi:formamidopyrimidine-DNA glycosylase